MKNVLDFLIQLKVNNNRNWFKENDKMYRTAKAEFDAFVEELIVALKKLDKSIDVESSKNVTFRIYRDVRFSKNKDPYKTNFGAFIARGGRKSPYAGYYTHFEPDQSFLGGGIYMPESTYLKAIRNAIYNNPQAYKDIIFEKNFEATFGEIWGDKLKGAPRGFDKDWPDLELIKNKHFAVSKKVENEFWISENPVQQAMKVFEKQYTFNNYLNKIVEKV